MADHWELRMFPWSNMPRFYPPGAHPALQRWYEHLNKLNELRTRVPDTPELLEQISYWGDKIAEFEQVESEMKALEYARARR